MSNGCRVRRSSRPPRCGCPRGQLLHRHRRSGRVGQSCHALACRARRGANFLNGRREPSDDQRNALDELADNTEIVFVSGDIALPDVAERLVAAAEETGRPLGGVVHAAGVTGEGLVAALTSEGMQRVWAPKVAGALRLHTGQPPVSSTGGSASLPWQRFSACPVSWRTQPPTPGSMP